MLLSLHSLREMFIYVILGAYKNLYLSYFTREAKFLGESSNCAQHKEACLDLDTEGSQIFYVVQYVHMESKIIVSVLCSC